MMFVSNCLQWCFYGFAIFFASLYSVYLLCKKKPSAATAIWIARVRLRNNNLTQEKINEVNIIQHKDNSDNHRNHFGVSLVSSLETVIHRSYDGVCFDIMVS